MSRRYTSSRHSIFCLPAVDPAPRQQPAPGTRLNTSRSRAPPPDAVPARNFPSCSRHAGQTKTNDGIAASLPGPGNGARFAPQAKNDQTPAGSLRASIDFLPHSPEWPRDACPRASENPYPRRRFPAAMRVAARYPQPDSWVDSQRPQPGVGGRRHTRRGCRPGVDGERSHPCRAPASRRLLHCHPGVGGMMLAEQVAGLVTLLSSGSDFRPDQARAASLAASGLATRPAGRCRQACPACLPSDCWGGRSSCGSCRRSRRRF